MRFTLDTVQRIGDHAKEISNGRFSFGYKANPGDGVRYIDGKSMTLVWHGSGAAHRAASYYLGIIEAYNPGTIGDLPDFIREALNAAIKRTGYEKWHNRGMDDAHGAILADAPKEYVIQGNYGHGWEDVNTETTEEDGNRSLREYRKGEPQFSHRLRTRPASN
ncbi:hypothetical protein [Streptomyces sp. NPDC088752]|uniref:hypothetical protein n=1 Tax=Streptomyces sp. NPDC088752 TaxID=3154963 RepID=UPI003429CB15